MVSAKMQTLLWSIPATARLVGVGSEKVSGTVDLSPPLLVLGRLTSWRSRARARLGWGGARRSPRRVRPGPSRSPTRVGASASTRLGRCAGCGATEEMACSRSPTAKLDQCRIPTCVGASACTPLGRWPDAEQQKGGRVAVPSPPGEARSVPEPHVCGLICLNATHRRSVRSSRREATAPCCQGPDRARAHMCVGTSACIQLG